MFKAVLCILVVIWTVVVQIECVFTPVIEVTEGKLRGLRSISGQDRYYGITYAASERFQPPTNPPRWNGIFNAVRKFGHCAQRVSILTFGTEQCQQLDVYAPEDRTTSSRLPVLVFIHGGAYYYGTKAHYDPEFLVTKNTVVVIINYRVGALGFLCLNGIANLGLKDQVAALKWIRKNIAAFGGDPENVTISGQSAGASSAAMHFLSESSKGLFHKAILMSGHPMTPWAFNAEPLTPAFEDARKLGTVNNEIDVYNILANASLADVLNSCRDVSWNSRYFKYSPCVDANYTSPFFRDTPHNIIKSGQFNKVPIIVGYTSVEGMLFYGINDDATFKHWNDNFIDRLPSVFSHCSDETRKKIAKKLRSYYFGNKKIDRRAIKGVVDYYSDWIAYSTTDDFIGLMNRYSDKPVYSYIFDYEGERNFAKMVFGVNTGLPGASHSDDMFYVFKPAGLSLLLSSKDRLFIDRLTTMFANFMKFGNPTPNRTALLPMPWPLATSGVLRMSGTLSVGPLRARSGGLMRKMLCTYGDTGYLPCEGTNEEFLK